MCFPCVYNDLGVFYKRTDRDSLAKVYFQNALEYDSTFRLGYLNLGFSKDKPHHLLYAIKQDSSDAFSWFSLGLFYNNRKEYAKAEQHLIKSVALDHTYYFSWNELGYSRLYLNRPEEALEPFEKALELYPEFSWAMNNLGRAYYRVGRLEEAKKVRSKLCELHPIAVYDIRLANVLAALGEKDRALELVEKTLKGRISYKQLTEVEYLPDLAKMPENDMLLREYYPEEFNE